MIFDDAKDVELDWALLFWVLLARFGDLLWYCKVMKSSLCYYFKNATEEDILTVKEFQVQGKNFTNTFAREWLWSTETLVSFKMEWWQALKTRCFLLFSHFERKSKDILFLLSICFYAVCLFPECFFAVCLFFLAAFLQYAFLLNAFLLYAYFF